MPKEKPPKPTSPATQHIVCIGIDWADETHAYHLTDQNGKPVAGTVRQQPGQIKELFEIWRQLFPDATFCVAIEQSKGPLINILLEFSDVQIYPINPAGLASYRKAFAHGGGKNDPSDAQLLCQYLENYRDQLRPLRTDDPLTKELTSLAEDRRRLVDQRSALCNELRAVLKLYFPVVLELQAAKLYAEFLIRFLRKYPTLTEAQKAGANKLRKFFYGVGAEKTAEARVQRILDAVPLTQNEVTIRCHARRVTAIVEMIHTLNTQIDRYDDAIHELVRQHADYAIVASLPGASNNSHCRIIAALGDDRTRFANASALQSATGIAPITNQSGKTKTVSCRWACSKFLKQTFHEYAALSITKSQWAKAYYDQQRLQGKSAQAARRALAYKWIRIIYRCWQDRVPYNEAKYIQRLKDTGSPLAKLLT
jgi:transposase